MQSLLSVYSFMKNNPLGINQSGFSVPLRYLLITLKPLQIRLKLKLTSEKMIYISITQLSSKLIQY